MPNIIDTEKERAIDKTENGSSYMESIEQLDS